MKHVYCVYGHNDGSMAYDYACDIVESLNNGDYSPTTPIDEVIWEYIDSSFIYYDDQWDLLKEYFNPNELQGDPLTDAMTMLADDIMGYIDEEWEDEDEECEDEDE